MTNDTRVREYPCNSWEDFIKAIRGKPDHSPFGKRICRGHADVKYKLSSILERDIKSQKEMKPDRQDTSDLIRVMRERTDEELSDFKDLAKGLPGLVTDSIQDANEWLALARHHGLRSPILDWTLSPYIAAFFAFMDALELRNPGFQSGGTAVRLGDIGGPVAIWSLIIDENKVEIPNEFQVIQTRKDDFQRQRAQQGVFTHLTHDTYLDVRSYLESRHLASQLGLFTIPFRETAKALTDLNMMNINFASLFPDLDGAAKHVIIGRGMDTLRTSTMFPEYPPKF